MQRGIGLLAAGIVGLSVVAAGAAYGHGGDRTRIHACVSTQGMVQIIAPHRTCLPGETATDWSITGPQGLQGLQGAQGPQGPAGTVHAYSGEVNNITINNDGPVLITLNVPAGKYTIHAALTLSNSDSDRQSASCELSTGQWAGVLLGGAGESLRIPMALTGTATFASPSSITLRCWSYDVFIPEAVLTAVEVQAIN